MYYDPDPAFVSRKLKEREIIIAYVTNMRYLFLCRMMCFTCIPFVLARLSSVSLLKYPVLSFYFVYQNVYNFTTVMIIMIYVSLEPLKYHLWFLLHYWKEIKFIILHCTNSLSLWQTFRHKRFVFFNDDNIYILKFKIKPKTINLYPLASFVLLPSWMIWRYELDDWHFVGKRRNKRTIHVFTMH